MGVQKPRLLIKGDTPALCACSLGPKANDATAFVSFLGRHWGTNSPASCGIVRA